MKGIIFSDMFKRLKKPAETSSDEEDQDESGDHGKEEKDPLGIVLDQERRKSIVEYSESDSENEETTTEPEKEKGERKTTGDVGFTLESDELDSELEIDDSVTPKQSRPASAASEVSTLGMGAVTISSEDEDEPPSNIPVGYKADHQTEALDIESLFKERKEDLNLIAKSMWSTYTIPERTHYQNIMNIVATQNKISEKGNPGAQEKFQKIVLPKYKDFKMKKFPVQPINKAINEALNSYRSQKTMGQFFSRAKKKPDSGSTSGTLQDVTGSSPLPGQGSLYSKNSFTL